MATLISNSPEETRALGESWGGAAQPGLVIGLTGDLGAGKTQLVKGIALGLGITTRVTSPSFALVNEYRTGRLPLFHLDLYRLDTLEQILGAGLAEYLLDPPGLAVVEWIERWTQHPGAEPAGMPPGFRRPAGRFRQVVIETTGERTRRISYEDSGT
jgi:tRNA threonylcarbamoyladenosine biosynthesis protein TsaE